MSGQDRPGLQAPHLSEFISSLENCEWALTREREALGSMVGDLKLQLQLQEQQQVAPSKRANGDGTMVRVKTERESVDIVSAEGYDGASAVTQVGGDGTEPIPSTRLQSLLRRERDIIRQKSVVVLNDPLPLAVAQTMPVAPLHARRKGQKRTRTELQLTLRREARRRRSERKRSRRLAALELSEIPQLPHSGSHTIGTAANRAPLPFNRISMPSPPPPPPSNIEPRMSGFIGPVHPDGYMLGQIHSFATTMPAPLPALQTHNQQDFFFHNTAPGLSAAPKIEANYELEEGEILSAAPKIEANYQLEEGEIQ